MDNKQYIIALEIASSKVAGCAAEFDGPTKMAEPICYFEEPVNESVRYGETKNVDEVCNKVSAVLRQIESERKISPRKIKSVYIGINARSLHSETVTIDRRISEEIAVSEALVKSIRNEATAKFKDVDILYVSPAKYEINGKSVENPIGELGSHLTSTFTVVTCKQQVCRNIKMVFDQLKLEICAFIPMPISLAKLILTDEELQLGCMVADCGADTTTVSIWRGGKAVYVNVLPMGSYNITRDLMSLNIIEDNAERIKKTYGLAPKEDLPDNEVAPGVRSVDIQNYISARAGEIIFNMVNQISLAGLKSSALPKGIILAGRGAKLKGFANKLREVSNMSLRCGMPGNGIDSKEYDRLGILSILDYAAESAPADQTCVVVPEMPKIEDYQEDDNKKTDKKHHDKSVNTEKPNKGIGFFGKMMDKIKGIGENINDGLYGSENEEESPNAKN